MFQLYSVHKSLRRSFTALSIHCLHTITINNKYIKLPCFDRSGKVFQVKNINNFHLNLVQPSFRCCTPWRGSYASKDDNLVPLARGAGRFIIHLAAHSMLAAKRIYISLTALPSLPALLSFSFGPSAAPRALIGSCSFQLTSMTVLSDGSMLEQLSFLRLRCLSLGKSVLCRSNNLHRNPCTFCLLPALNTSCVRIAIFAMGHVQRARRHVVCLCRPLL